MTLISKIIKFSLFMLLDFVLYMIELLIYHSH